MIYNSFASVMQKTVGDCSIMSKEFCCSRVCFQLFDGWMPHFFQINIKITSHFFTFSMALSRSVLPSHYCKHSEYSRCVMNLCCNIHLSILVLQINFLRLMCYLMEFFFHSVSFLLQGLVIDTNTTFLCRQYLFFSLWSCLISMSCQ